MNRSVVVLCLLLAARSSAQEKKLDTLLVRTSALCEKCEKTIEGGLIYERGVKKVDLDLQADVIHVIYDPHRTDPAKIRTAVTKLGYAADDMPADPKAFKELESCCRKHQPEKR